uniref:Reverse transcriptase Ty1/copia-type domain-containing protein n=1 Tax=Cannabis sativa TaxID=3483 RepID=A0A803PAZ4_CANSA
MADPTSAPQQVEGSGTPTSEASHQSRSPTQAAASVQTAAMSPLPVTTPFGSTLIQPFTMKLDRHNFPLWKTMVFTIIRGHRLEGFINGQRTPPKEFIISGIPKTPEYKVTTNPDFENWLVHDQLGMEWLYGSMTEGIASEVMGCQLAFALWSAFENLFGEPYPERHLVSNVLSGLKIEYLSIISVMEVRSETSWQEQQSILRSFNNRLERLTAAPPSHKNSGSPSANLAHKPTGPGGSRYSNDYSQEADNNVSIEFFPSVCCVKDRATGKVVLQGVLRDGLYRLNTSLLPKSHHPCLQSTKFQSVSCAGVATTAPATNNSRVHESVLDLWHRSQAHKGFRCLSPHGRIYISRHVIFNENEFPCQHGFFDNYKPEQTVTLDAPHSWFTLPVITQSCTIDKTQCISPLPEASTETTSPTHHSAEPSTRPHDSSPQQVCSSEFNTDTAVSPVLQPSHPMITRAKVGVYKPKVYLGYAKFDTSLHEPHTVEEALLHEGWNCLMQDEMTALRRNRTWTLVPRSSLRSPNIVGCKWVHKIKYNADGSLQRLKSRLVAKGFHQRSGVDFVETFSPVIKASTVQVVLTIAVTYNWEIRQLDVNNAFLNGILEEDVFMMQPSGFEDTGKPDYVCKLNKSIYGLRQAPRLWYDQLRRTLVEWNFENSKADSSLFLKKTSKYVIIVLIYVDDIIVTGSSSGEIEKFVVKLNKIFSLKDLGQLHYFLGIEVFRNETGLYLSQRKYIAELLQKHNMANIKPSPTPMTAGSPLSIKDGEPLEKPSEYKSVIGALQYLSHTRPDISFVVNKLRTMYLGLHIAPSVNLNLQGFSDVDWACCPYDRRSLAGYCVFLGESLISWSSKKQNIVARSSTESEYRSLAHLAAELTWLQELWQEMKFKASTTPIIWCDNMSACALASNLVFHARTKHIELNVHFVRDKVLQKKLGICYIPSHDQTVDCLTKGLSPSRFKFLVDKLRLVDSPLRLRGGVKNIG